MDDDLFSDPRIRYYLNIAGEEIDPTENNWVAQFLSERFNWRLPDTDWSTDYIRLGIFESEEELTECFSIDTEEEEDWQNRFPDWIPSYEYDEIEEDGQLIQSLLPVESNYGDICLVVKVVTGNCDQVIDIWSWSADEFRKYFGNKPNWKKRGF